MKGEHFAEIIKVITEEQAWNRIFGSVSFSIHFTHKVRNSSRMSANRIRDDLMEEWKKKGINWYSDYYLRKDGMVEVRA